MAWLQQLLERCQKLSNPLIASKWSAILDEIIAASNDDAFPFRDVLACEKSQASGRTLDPQVVAAWFVFASRLSFSVSHWFPTYLRNARVTL